MALAITCSQCNKGYRVPNDAAGRAIKCRQCGTRIPVPSPEAPASEDDFFGLLSDAVALEQELEALPERRHAKSGTSAKPRTSGNGSPSTKKANQRGLLHVAKGLSIIRIAVVIRTVVFLLALTLSLIPDAILRTLPIGIWPVLNWTSLVGSIVGKLLMLAGLLLCISATPAKAKARALLIVAAFFEIAGACFSEFVGLFAGRLPFLLLAFLGILGGLISQAALLPLLVYVKMLSCFIRYKSGEDDEAPSKL